MVQREVLGGELTVLLLLTPGETEGGTPLGVPGVNVWPISNLKLTSPQPTLGSVAAQIKKNNILCQNKLFIPPACRLAGHNGL